VRGKADRGSRNCGYRIIPQKGEGEEISVEPSPPPTFSKRRRGGKRALPRALSCSVIKKKRRGETAAVTRSAPRRGFLRKREKKKRGERKNYAEVSSGKVSGPPPSFSEAGKKGVEIGREQRAVPRAGGDEFVSARRGGGRRGKGSRLAGRTPSILFKYHIQKKRRRGERKNKVLARPDRVIMCYFFPSKEREKGDRFTGRASATKGKKGGKRRGKARSRLPWSCRFAGSLLTFLKGGRKGRNEGEGGSATGSRARVGL